MMLLHKIKPYPMKPYAQQGLDAEKRLYNFRHSRARCISENLFGILANRWRFMRNVMLLHPDVIEVLSCMGVLWKKPPVWAKVKKETKPTNLEAPVQQNELSLEEQQLLETSRQVLEAKAALYDKMAQGEIKDEEDDEGVGRFLLDFHRKVYSKEEESQQNSEGLKDEDIPPPSRPHDEWLDYVDLLGRESKWLCKDLKQRQETDKDIMVARESCSSYWIDQRISNDTFD
ncbi:PREDICTED: coiled-coil domain-containing protein 174-like isoform X4 [Acropora digitifera]|uniref:coiled-coil domain-containing protein 174-like isoform X4 n=1 Tax=Acropora digitifera TaxID=70779 RepID=UPI00077B1DDE|nr:PREDICTED: coiled-coil domain-containing protein 174-like isoform X4 [Acropora digitifera]